MDNCFCELLVGLRVEDHEWLESAGVLDESYLSHDDSCELKI